MSESMSQLAENKLILLYLINKMSMPLSNSEICLFALEKDYMDYFSLQQYLGELVDSEFLEVTKENNTMMYTITDEGLDVLSYFINHISDKHKNEINVFVNENKGRIRAEYDITANYFPEINNDFLVKCGICESDGTSLMELSVLVPTKEQAQNICYNWKKNVNDVYSNIMSALTCDKYPADKKIEPASTDTVIDDFYDEDESEEPENNVSSPDTAEEIPNT